MVVKNIDAEDVLERIRDLLNEYSKLDDHDEDAEDVTGRDPVPEHLYIQIGTYRYKGHDDLDEMDNLRTFTLDFVDMDNSTLDEQISELMAYIRRRFTEYEIAEYKRNRDKKAPKVRRTFRKSSKK